MAAIGRIRRPLRVGKTHSPILRAATRRRQFANVSKATCSGRVALGCRRSAIKADKRALSIGRLSEWTSRSSDHGMAEASGKKWPGPEIGIASTMRPFVSTAALIAFGKRCAGRTRMRPSVRTVASLSPCARRSRPGWINGWLGRHLMRGLVVTHRVKDCVPQFAAARPFPK